MCFSRMLWRRQQRLIERDILGRVEGFIEAFDALQLRVDSALSNAKNPDELDAALSLRSQQMQLAVGFGFELARTFATQHDIGGRMEKGGLLEPGNPKRIAAEREVVKLAWKYLHGIAALRARWKEPVDNDEVDECHEDLDILQSGFCRKVESALGKAVD